MQVAKYRPRLRGFSVREHGSRMVRINRLLPVLLVTAAAYAEDGVDAMCQGADEATLLLRGADFEVTGYDSGRGVLTLRPAATLVRERAPLTLRSGGPLLLAMGAEELEAALDARSRGALVLDLTVRCEVRAQDGPLLQPCCVAATPAVARQRSGQMLLAERDLSRAASDAEASSSAPAAVAAVG